MSGKSKVGRWAGGSHARPPFFGFFRRTTERPTGDSMKMAKWDPLVGARAADTPRRWL